MRELLKYLTQSGLNKHLSDRGKEAVAHTAQHKKNDSKYDSSEFHEQGAALHNAAYKEADTAAKASQAKRGTRSYAVDDEDRAQIHLAQLHHRLANIHHQSTERYNKQFAHQPNLKKPKPEPKPKNENFQERVALKVILEAYNWGIVTGKLLY